MGHLSFSHAEEWVQKVSIPIKERGRGGGVHDNCSPISWEGVQKVSYPRFTHFVAPSPSPDPAHTHLPCKE